MAVCMHCGSEVQSGVIFCPGCGAQLKAAVDSQSRPAKKQGQMPVPLKLKIVLGVLALMCVFDLLDFIVEPGWMSVVSILFKVGVTVGLFKGVEGVRGIVVALSWFAVSYGVLLVLVAVSGEEVSAMGVGYAIFSLAWPLSLIMVMRAGDVKSWIFSRSAGQREFMKSLDR